MGVGKMEEAEMRLIFGVMSLLIVLAVIGILGKKQFQALGLVGQNAAAQGADVKAATDAVMGRAGGERVTVAVPGGVPAAVAAPVTGTVAAQSRAIQSNVRNAVNAAVEQGAARSAQEPKQ